MGFCRWRLFPVPFVHEMASPFWLSFLTWRIQSEFSALPQVTSDTLVLDDVLPARHRVPPADGGGGGGVLCRRRSCVPRAASGVSSAATEGRGLDHDGAYEHDGNGARRGRNGAAYLHIPGKKGTSLYYSRNI